MPRPQFSLHALLVTMLVVAAFFGGMAVQRRLDQRKAAEAVPVDIVVGVHTNDLESFFSDLNEKAKAAVSREGGD